MNTSFEPLGLSKFLQHALEDLNFENPTPIQVEAFPLIKSGQNLIGISQTGTGKTLAFMLPILQELSFSRQATPRVVVLVPTRELVSQIVEEIEKFSSYLDHRIFGIYGGTNINTQKASLKDGVDILVATPGRLYDIVADGFLKLRDVKQVVIDEVDVMLDLGFRFQLNNLFELMPKKRQNILFSATMTEEIETLLEDFFVNPAKISIALSGTPLENIEQSSYELPNFYTKINLLQHLLKDQTQYKKVLVFVSGKRNADRIFEKLDPYFTGQVGIIHSNKSQNFRFKAIENFEEGKSRILVSTDVMSRGLDLSNISHVISFDAPQYPENYMHRIGRTGRAEASGSSILLTAPYESEAKSAIEQLMNSEIPKLPLPEHLEISNQLTPAERPADYVYKIPDRNAKTNDSGGAFHEKKKKNQKTNLGGSYKRKLNEKYKKPKTRGGKKR